MTIRNGQLSHLVKRPCRKCHKPVSALDKRGVMQMFPVCPSCSEQYQHQFNQALAQRKVNSK